MTSSKSATKIARPGHQRPGTASDHYAESRKSLNTQKSDDQFMNKPVNRKLYEKPAYIVKSGITQSIGTPSFACKAGYKTSGILTARTAKPSSIEPEEHKSDKNIGKNLNHPVVKEELRTNRAAYKQIRAKGRKDGLMKESSSSSSKVSLN
mmetsp:Transcript_7209/g.8187  ORF Transcript_7209/g.8187 Transcript_7209/m.8187 type:complete len:151 (+) Transcript_7209:472-924(+)